MISRGSILEHLGASLRTLGAPSGLELDFSGLGSHVGSMLGAREPQQTLQSDVVLSEIEVFKISGGSPRKCRRIPKSD